MQQITRSVAGAIVLAFNFLPKINRVIISGLLIFIILGVVTLCPYILYNIDFFTQKIIKIMQSKDRLNNKFYYEITYKNVVSAGYYFSFSKIINYNLIDISNITATTNNLYLQPITWELSNNKTNNTYNFVEKKFSFINKIHQNNWKNSIIKGKIIEKNFFSTARESGLTNSEISSIINVMQWKIDFNKLKKDDEFAVLISRKIINGKHELSQLIGVRLRSSGKNYYAIRAKNGKFYDHKGTGLTKGFLRFPTEKRFRVSSNFNPCRLNPVTGSIAPHRGVDFAMPQGTPILAIGDGEVVMDKRSRAAGYSIAIRHGDTYTTRYMHLHKLLVKSGQKVKRGDCIALSGNTGNSTGPHLHYEVWINQQAVNPLTAKLPITEYLTGSYRSNYLAHVKEVIPQLHLD